MTEILLVEDDDRLRSAMALSLGGEAYTVSIAASLAEAQARFAGPGGEPDVLLLDVRLGPRDSGIDLVRQLAAANRLPPTVVISGAASIAETVEALRLGVFDFIEKPVSRERLLQSVRNAHAHDRLQKRVQDLEQRLDSGRQLLGASSAMNSLREQIGRLAPTEARVLIQGESGTGKELVAEQIHARSRRRERPFIKLNCAALPASLVEAELFGHARGAFTDARVARPGLFEEADGGTLFLDEIGDMNLQAQSSLLRVLEDGTVRRLGESQERRVDVRVLSATHQDLETAAQEGRFRQDLFFRLAHVPLRAPPLREHADDIPPLFRHFVGLLSAQHRLRPKCVQDDVYVPLLSYAWPGNVRELRSVCERLVVLGTDPIALDQLPAQVFRRGRVEDKGWLRPARLSAGDIAPFREFKAECEREYLESTLQRTGWNLAAAARDLGLQRTYLHAKILSLGIARPDRPVKDQD